MKTADAALARRVFRNDFSAFLVVAFTVLNPRQKLNRSWYLEALGYALGEVAAGRSKRLVVNIPPRHLKSTAITIAWVAWCLGRDPTLRFMCISFSEILAAELARACRTLMESDAYRRIFPGTILTKRSELHLETSMGGHRIATSLFGSITGRGADIVILDDPIDANDAQSEVMREKVDEIFRNTVVSRPNDPNSAKFIVVQQRLHEDDLTGRLIGRSDWNSLVISAIAQEDEVHQVGAERFHHRPKGALLDPLRMSERVLNERRIDMGLEHFSAQYLQAPLPEQGSIIRREWLRSSPFVRRQSGDLVIHSWDTAVKTGKENDYSACISAVIRDRRIYVTSAIRGKYDFPELYQRIAHSTADENPSAILIEDAASGSQMLQYIPTSPLPFNVEPIAVRYPGSKAEKAARASVFMQRGNVLLCEDMAGKDDLLREVLSIPSGKHDDLADALVQLVLYVMDIGVLFPSPQEVLRNVSPWYGQIERPDDEPWDPDEIDADDM